MDRAPCRELLSDLQRLQVADPSALNRPERLSECKKSGRVGKLGKSHIVESPLSQEGIDEP
jgi:hypothetical protein